MLLAALQRSNASLKLFAGPPSLPWEAVPMRTTLYTVYRAVVVDGTGDSTNCPPQLTCDLFDDDASKLETVHVPLCDPSSTPTLITDRTRGSPLLPPLAHFARANLLLPPAHAFVS